MPMKRGTTVAIKVSENHRRSISTTLQLIDQALCEWDDWMSGRLQSSIMYREIDTLSAIQKQQLNNKIANIRQLIMRLRDDLDRTEECRDRAFDRHACVVTLGDADRVKQ